MGGIFVTDDAIYYNSPFSNTVYELQNGNAHQFLTVDFGKANIPDWTTQDSLFKNLRNYNYLEGNFIKSNNIVGFNIFRHNSIELIAYNIQSKKVYSNSKLLSPLNGLFYNLIHESSGQFIMPVNRNYLADFVKNTEKDIITKFPNNLEKLRQASPHESPALLLFKLNDN